MNEPDVINNRYQLHLAMEAARNKLPELFTEYAVLSGRELSFCGAYRHEDAEVLLFVLGSSYHTAMEAVDRLRQDGVTAGVITLYVLRPFPAKELRVLCHNASTILVADRQDSYGAGGGNMSLEIKAALSSLPHPPRILSRIYGLGGKDFFVEDALALFKAALSPDAPAFDYYGVTAGTDVSDAADFRKDIFLWNRSGDGGFTPGSLYQRRYDFKCLRQS